MTYTQLAKAIHALLPDATFGEDVDGQLIIFTKMKQANPSDDEDLVTFDD